MKSSIKWSRRAYFEKLGHQTTVVGNGREALAALEASEFDVVLMDIQMPEMDGFEAVAAIRERERRTNVHVPVVAMTAHAMKGDREHCLEAGFDGYLSKPIRAKELGRGPCRHNSRAEGCSGQPGSVAREIARVM